MADDSGKLKAKLSALNRSLDELETQLDPLLAQTLPETLVGLETIQQAKLQVALPYLVHGLTFVYLKTRGIDPKSHPVLNELERTRQYFDKIKDAEDPAKRKTTVNKAAASRFIKHAITQVTSQPPPTASDQVGTPGPSVNTHIRFPQPEPVARVPVKVTSKMLAREQYEKEMKEAGSEAEDDLEVFDEDSASEPATAAVARKDQGKGKAREAPSEDVPRSAKGGKRRRAAVDPFGGYGSDQDRPSAKPKGKGVVDLEADSVAETSTPAGSGTESSPAKSQKKRRNKSKASASGS